MKKVSVNRIDIFIKIYSTDMAKSGISLQKYKKINVVAFYK